MQGNKNKLGSEQSTVSEPSHLVIGRITRPHGVHGEVRATIHTEEPDRFHQLDQVLVGEEKLKPTTVKSIRFHQKIVILKFEDCTTREQAENLRGEWLLVPIEDAIPLDDGEFFLYQLIGLDVRTIEGRDLGIVKDILQTGANDVFVVQGPDGEFLLPDIADVVLNIDLDSNLVLVQLPAGLYDDSLG